MSLNKCHIINLATAYNEKGNLTFVEGGRHIPFDIKRVYYLFDVPRGASRGGHAHKALEQLIIAMSGSFDVNLSDGFQTKKYHLNRSYQGLYVCSMIWGDIDNFSSGSVCAVLASTFYDREDYYYDYEDFVLAAKFKKQSGEDKLL